MKMTENYDLRFMAGEYVLVPKGDFLLEGKQPLMINEMTSDILKAVENGSDTAEKITEHLMSIYDASYDEISSVVQDMLKQLTDLMVIA